MIRKLKILTRTKNRPKRFFGTKVGTAGIQKHYTLLGRTSVTKIVSVAYVYPEVLLIILRHQVKVSNTDLDFIDNTIKFSNSIFSNRSLDLEIKYGMIILVITAGDTLRHVYFKDQNLIAINNFLAKFCLFN